MGNKASTDAAEEESTPSQSSPQRAPSYYQQAKDGYDSLVDAIIRPPRADYDLAELGPPEFTIRGRRFARKDFDLVNKLGLTIRASHWEPVLRGAPTLPCVVYLHGNSSCRAEAIEYVETVLSLGVTLMAIDFAGCGMSEGQYISLGWFEQDDVATVMEYLRSTGTVSTVGLWGRSMGAATALMFGHRDLSIAAMVLDSPFSSLPVLCRELSSKIDIPIPGFLVSGALSMIRSSIKSRANFDIYKVVPSEHVETCFIPAIFTAANDDDFILPSHTEQIHEKYAGDKNLIMVPGNHNTSRPRFLQDSVAIFLFSRLCQPVGMTNDSLSNSLLASAHLGDGMNDGGRSKDDGGGGEGAHDGFGEGEVDIRSLEDWACTSCTFINDYTQTMCSMCQEHRGHLFADTEGH